MKITLFFFASLLNLLGTHVPIAQALGGSQSIPQTPLQKPPVGVRVADPAFKTTILRVTNSRSAGMKGIFPEYSKRQAWNADESLLLLREGDGKALLYNGQSYQFLKILEEVGGDDVFWHPKDPQLLVFFIENKLYSLNVGSGPKKLLFTFPGYSFVGTKGEGNLSLDGRFLALVGQVYQESNQQVQFKDLLVFDLASNLVSAKLALPAGLQAFDWVSISPKGTYVVVDYADGVSQRFHGLEVYDRALKFLWQKPLGAGHSDLAVDVNGEEVLVMDSYDPDLNQNLVKKFRLSDGTETRLLAMSALFDQHISCQNLKKSGWCLISTFDYVQRLTDNPPAGWLPFEDEIFFLKLDGSGSVERLGHHRSRRFSPATPDSDKSNYFAEPHATVSRNGDRVLFGSNWREAIADLAGVDGYVLQVNPR